jgi:uncharacterized protein (DUF302 family)
LPFLIVLVAFGCGGSPKPSSQTQAARVGSECECATGSTAPATGAGTLRVLASDSDVATTTRRIEAEIAARGLRHFATIDHAANAEKAGLELAPTRVILFGNPKVGTQLMGAQPTIALNLPMKILVYKDDESVKLAYEHPQSLADRHGLDGHGELLGKIEEVLAAIANRGAHGE